MYLNNTYALHNTRNGSKQRLDPRNGFLDSEDEMKALVSVTTKTNEKDHYFISGFSPRRKTR